MRFVREPNSTRENPKPEKFEVIFHIEKWQIDSHNEDHVEERLQKLSAQPKFRFTFVWKCQDQEEKKAEACIDTANCTCLGR
jgi:hypothetical protein